jgi:polyisoprenoid-binding protein YceI
MKKLLVATAAFGAFAAPAAQAAPAAYAIDPTHTFVTFEIGHFGTSTNRARFDRKEGAVQFDRAGRVGTVEISIDMTSVNSGTPAFDKHLQSPDLLDAARFPTARFVGDRFAFDGNKVSTVAGTLTLLGTTRPVTLKALNFNCYTSPLLKREVCGGDFETTLLRSQYGLKYGLDWGFPDSVKLIIQVEAIQQ